MWSLFSEVMILVWKMVLSFLESWFFFIFSRNEKCVKGDIVLVTGGANGIGKEIVKKFVKLGASVVIWDIDECQMKRTITEVKQSNEDQQVKISGYVCDLSNKDDVLQTAKLVKEEIGDVTILINNACTVIGKGLLDVEDKNFISAINVNMISHFWTIKCFLPAMIKQNHGHIVTISSTAGIMGIRGLVPYCTAKFGLVGLTETLDYELVFGGHDGVHTTLVCPYHTNTSLFAGCGTRFPFVFPILDRDWVVKKIVYAILTNQKQVYMPRSMYLMNIFKVIIPVKCMYAIHRLFAVDCFMENYKENPSTKDSKSE